MSDADLPLAQRAGQEVRSDHRVLDGEVDTYASDWRDDVGGISEEQETGPVPPPQKIRLNREQGTLSPVLQPRNSVRKFRGKGSHRIAERRNSLLLETRIIAFRDDVSHLPVIGVVHQY